MLIKIDRDSIRPNKRAGQTETSLKGAASATIKVYGEHKFFNDSNFILTEHALERGATTPWLNYLVIDTSKLDNIITEAEKLGITITVDFKQERQVYYHDALPKYIYRYHLPLITCPKCGDIYPLSEVNTDYDDDDNKVDYCPNCDTILELPEYEYENIDDVLKELHLSD